MFIMNLKSNGIPGQLKKQKVNSTGQQYGAQVNEMKPLPGLVRMLQ
jgi:hypothetical protein